MKGNWKDLLYFNRRERNGISVVLVLILIAFGVQQLLPFFADTSSEADISRLNAYVALLEAKRDSTEKSYATAKKQRNYNYPSAEKSKQTPAAVFQPIAFNPNTAPDSVWALTGLNKGQIRSIRNFQRKGGDFKVKRDVAKLYVVDEEWYQKVAPFILLPDSIAGKKKPLVSEKETFVKEKPAYPNAYDTLVVELNSADTARLKVLRGIGDYYANAIVKYRAILGGYVDTAQLSEVYNMRSETLARLQGHIWVDTSLVKKLDINSLSAGQLSRHPYMSWNMAKSIVAYRNEHGRFKKVSKLYDVGLLNGELYRKIAPYLKVTTSDK